MKKLENTVETEQSGSLPALVFVHLSTAVPRYVWANIKRTAKIFPSLRVVLISDLDENLVRAKTLGIAVSPYKADQEILELLANRTLNSEFRKGFWKTSILRLFAYLEFVEANGTPAIHIESDILLMRDFPWDKLAALERLAWLQFNGDRDVAALITCPSGIEAKWLNETLRAEIKLKSSCTDMTILSDISQKNGNKVYLLPIAPKSDSKLFQLNSSSEVRSANSRLYTELGGIFDGAALGMWLCGQDARNNFGLLKRHVNLFDSYIDTSDLKVAYSRGSLFYVEDNQKYKIFNLHLHSKIEMDFGKLWLIRLILNSKLASIRYELITFAPKKFLEFVQSYKDRLGRDPIKLVMLIFRKLRSQR